MSIFKRDRSPFWQCEVEVGGRRFARSTGEIDKRKAREWERKFRAELEAQVGKPQRKELTLDQACARWWLEHGQKLESAKGEARNLKRIVGSLGTTINLSDVTNENVALVVDGIEREGNGPASVNRCLATFRRVLRRAGRVWGLHVNQINWPDHFRKEPKGRTRWLTAAEVERLLAECPEPIRVAVVWSILTGCRKSETWRIKWADVDFDRGQVKITKGKTGARVVWLTDETRALLLTLRPETPNPAASVFDGTNHRKLFEAAVERAGLEDFTWHDMRHTCASWLRQKGAPLEIVARVLGHASIKTTERYAHVADEEVTQALGKLPSLSVQPEAGNVVPLRRRKK